MKRHISWVFIFIIALAIFARLYGLDLETLSLEQRASVLISVSAGVLSVIGFYFLAKETYLTKNSPRSLPFC